MGGLSIWHWLIVLIVIILVFGTGKLRNLGKDLGGAIKGFKEGMKDGEQASEPDGANVRQVKDGREERGNHSEPIDVQSKEKS